MYKQVTGESIRQLFRRGAKGLVIYDETYPELLLGYIVTEKTRLMENVVHYIWVRDGYRGKGLTQVLFKEAGINPDESFFYTFWTKAVTKCRLFKTGIHEPAIARRRYA